MLPTALLPTDDLQAAVVELSRPYLDRGLVALYAHGSAAGGETDAWSDLDLGLIREPSEEAHLAAREWLLEVEKRFEHRVDPLAASRDELAANTWMLTYLRHSLLARSRLLLGQDIRSEIARPSEHFMRLSVAYVGMTWLRRFYDIIRFEPFALPTDRPAQALDDFPHGNAAWQFSAGLMQLVRATLFLETRRYCEGRKEVLALARQQGDGRLVAWVEEALAVRREFPRFGEIPTDSERLARLAEAIPELAERFLAALAAHDLVDPTYEGLGGSAYEPDGARREQPPEDVTFSRSEA